MSSFHCFATRRRAHNNHRALRVLLHLVSFLFTSFLIHIRLHDLPVFEMPVFEVTPFHTNVCYSCTVCSIGSENWCSLSSVEQIWFLCAHLELFSWVKCRDSSNWGRRAGGVPTIRPQNISCLVLWVGIHPLPQLLNAAVTFALGEESSGNSKWTELNT